MLPFEFIIKEAPLSDQTKKRQGLRQWKEAVRQAATAQLGTGAVPVTVPVRISITYFYEGRTPDVDNIIKPIQDALNGGEYSTHEQHAIA